MPRLKAVHCISPNFTNTEETRGAAHDQVSSEPEDKDSPVDNFGVGILSALLATSSVQTSEPDSSRWQPGSKAEGMFQIYMGLGGRKIRAGS